MGDESTLQDHYERDGGDFNAQGVNDYAQKANSFYNQRGEPGNQVKYDFSNGNTRIWQPSTGTYGSYDYDGFTRTFYKPTAGESFDFDGKPGSTIP